MRDGLDCGTYQGQVRRVAISVSFINFTRMVAQVSDNRVLLSELVLRIIEHTKDNHMCI